MIINLLMGADAMLINLLMGAYARGTRGQQERDDSAA